MPTGQEDYHTFSEIPALVASDLVRCSYSSWYGKYKQFVVSDAEIIKPLPDAFIEYLLSDGIALPAEDMDTSLQNDSDYSDWEDDETEGEQQITMKRDPTSAFTDLHEDIKRRFKKLGSTISPKLNWSAPKDATWILPNSTMKCHNVKDLYLLLNASNYVMHDLTEAFSQAAVEKPVDFEYELVLRKWYEDINPALEFRCFVKNRMIIGISQRDLNYYSFLDELYDQIFDATTAFFETHLQTTFDIDNFVFDVYIPRPFEKVYLIDMNPFTRVTDSLLFTWNELALINEREADFLPELRLVDEVNTARFASKEHSENQVPKDIVDATMDASAMADLAREWRRVMDKEEVSSDDESDE